MSTKYSKALQLPVIESESIRMKFGNNSTSVSSCSAKVKITFKRKAFHQEFIIYDDLPTDCLFGLDFLTNANILIRFGSRIIQPEDSIFNNDLPVNLINSNHKPVKISAAHHDVIQPYSSQIIECVANESIDGVALFEAKNNSKVRVEDALITLVKGTTHIVVHNTLGNPIRLTTEALGHIHTTDEESTYFVQNSPSKAIDIDSGKILDSITFNDKLELGELTKLKSLCQEYIDIFATKLSDLKGTNVIEHIIDTEQSVKPIKLTPYRIAQTQKEEIMQQVTELKMNNFIRRSSSPWSFPIVPVMKKDGTTRMCVDYRKLNSVTIKDANPLPLISDTLEALSGHKYFTSLDLFSGYWQVPIRESDRNKTAFSTPDGLYEFNVMPFGLCNAPSTFSRLMSIVLEGLIGKTCLVYLDDVVVIGRTFNEHLDNLKKVFEAFRRTNLKLKPSKCYVGQYEVYYLGYVISQKGISTDPNKIKSIEEFPTPKDVSSVRRFLGLTGYYRQFVKDYAKLASPLYDLTRKESKFEWSMSCENSFKNLKQNLIEAPILIHFNPNLPIYLSSDASITGLGAILFHIVDNKEHPVAYFSRALNNAEKNYSVTELECLGIVFAIRKCHTYLYGRPFTIVTDHNALKWLQSIKEGNRRLINWSLFLQNYNFTVVYKRGKKHTNVDALSRAPLIGCDSVNEADLSETIMYSSINEHIAQAQKDDKDIRLLFHKIKLNPKNHDEFKIEDGILYRYENRRFNCFKQLVLPLRMVRSVFYNYHDDPFAGHMGISRTLFKLRERFWRPNLKKLVKEYIRTCTTCQLLKRNNRASAGQLGMLEPGRSAFDVISIDTAGPLPKSRHQNEYLFVATCRLTKFVIVKAARKHTADNVAKFILEDIILIHGPPRILISDNGTEYVNLIVASILRQLNIKHHRTPVYNPMSNGQTECYNRTWKSIVSAYVNNKGNDWDEYVKYATYAYNSSVHETTGLSPYFAVYLREPKSFDDYRFNIGEEQFSILTKLRFYQEIRRYLMNKIQHAHERTKERFDKRRQIVAYRKGDKVLINRPVVNRNLGKAFTPAYEGPFTVVKQLGNVTYILKRDNGAPRWNFVKMHVKNLRPFYRREDADKDISTLNEGGVSENCRSLDMDQDVEHQTTKPMDLNEESVPQIKESTGDATIEDTAASVNTRENTCTAEENLHNIRRSGRNRNPPNRYGYETDY